MAWRAAVLTIGLVGCFGADGVGDPCLPPEPTGEGPTASFLGTEIYVETRSLQCRTHVCVVDHWDQLSDPGDRNRHAYCTCRCDGPGDPTSLCQCPSGFDCLPVFSTGPLGVQGRYCLRTQE